MLITRNRDSHWRRGATALAIGACLAALAASAAGPAVGSSTEEPAPCRPAGNTTLASDGRALVYGVSVDISPPVNVPAGTDSPALSVEDIFGCILATGRSIRLGTTGPAIGTGPIKPANGSLDPKEIALHTPWVAYSSTANGTDFSQAWVVLRNLRTGKVKRVHKVGPEPVEPETFFAVPGVVVSATGGFAWISEAAAIGGTTGIEVAAVDSAGSFRVLDMASNIRPNSLQLHGHRLSWMDGDSRNSARLR